MDATEISERDHLSELIRETYHVRVDTHERYRVTSWVSGDPPGESGRLSKSV